jgi:hypothetical protein
MDAVFFARKNFSIVLDTHALGEQDHAVVSPFVARLPLRIPKAVKAPQRALRGQNLLGFFFNPSRGAQLPVRRTGQHTTGRQRFQGNITHSRLAFRGEGKSDF